MEKKMDKQVVENAMNPLDVAFANIAVLRKTDTGEIKAAAGKVKTALSEEIVRDVAKSLLEGIVPEQRMEIDVTPPKVKAKAVDKKATPVKPAPAKKATAKKAEPKVVDVTPEKVTPTKKGKGADKGLRGNSSVAKPTKLVWTIAEKVMKANKKAKRADILAECAKAGITFYTARTQYQLWKASKS